MSSDKELEIRLQFLEEAQEYVETLESCLLGLAHGVDGEKVNEALRAAHSIKGGAGLMGFQTLSDYAHRLEDGLKVLKVQRQKVGVDGELETLLLQGVDCLNAIMGFDRAQTAVDPGWLAAQAEPVFQALHDRLGDPQEEDAHSMLSPEDGQDIIPLLFQTEVEGCLERLETALTQQSPCLKEEALILAQELGGLGEMLQIPPFIQLCQSIGASIEAAAGAAIEPLVREALAVWRRSQALVLTGNLSSLPDHFGAAPAEVTAGAEASPDEVLADLNLSDPVADDLAVEAVFDAFLEEVDDPTLPLDLISSLAVDLDADAEADVAADAEADAAVDAAGDMAATLPSADLQITPYHQATDAADASDAATEAFTAWEMGTGSAQFASQPETPQAAQKPTSDATPENTVRVPVKQVNQLSDLFGELTIERNRLELEVKRLRDLVITLQGRLRTLDQVNGDLRTNYDRVATQADSSVLRPLLPPVADSTSPVSNGGYLLKAEAPAESAFSEHFDVLELDRYRDLHLPFREIIETIVQLQEVGADIDLSLDNTEQASRSLRKTARQLQKNLTQLRMRPLADVFDRFPRALRQMSLQYGKPVDLKIEGARTLVDRNILEALQEPLTHIVRNCFDHGIEDAATRQQRGKPERGLITINAYQQNNRTLITIRDDGGGIPIEKIRDRARQMGLDESLLAAASQQDLLSLIFEPGFTTASQVTDLSGRGIGMDAVRSKLKEIRGDIQVDTEAGVGTTFTLSIPFTLSVTRVLLVESRGMRIAFPVDMVDEMLMLSPEQIMNTAGKVVFNWENEIVQLIQLSHWLVFNCPVYWETPEIAPTISDPTVLMVQHNNRYVGIQVDRSWGEQEVALRRVEGNLPLPPGFNSCTILGDGQVVPLVNVPEMLYWIASYEASGDAHPSEATKASGVFAYLPEAEAVPGQPHTQSPPIMPQRPIILVIDDSINVRRLLALTLEKAGYQVAQAKDGQDALDKLQAGLAATGVLCDVEMPRLDGYGFLAQLKAQAQWEDLPVIMLTSRSSEKHRQLAISLGAAAYFTKPYNEQKLLQTLETLTTVPVG